MEAKLIQKENLPTTPSGKHLPFSMAAKMNCDKFSLEGEGKLAEVDLGPMKAGVGGFIEGSVNRTNGDVTVYGGPKASGEFGPFSGSFKDGAAITVDSNGNPKEIALQVDASASAGAGGIKGSLKRFSGEGTKFTIWSAPPRPPKFDRGTGLTIWGNR
jgi:hypothetical protein